VGIHGQTDLLKVRLRDKIPAGTTVAWLHSLLSLPPWKLPKVERTVTKVSKKARVPLRPLDYYDGRGRTEGRANTFKSPVRQVAVALYCVLLWTNGRMC